MENDVAFTLDSILTTAAAWYEQQLQDGVAAAVPAFRGTVRDSNSPEPAFHLSSAVSALCTTDTPTNDGAAATAVDENMALDFDFDDFSAECLEAFGEISSAASSGDADSLLYTIGVASTGEPFVLHPSAAGSDVVSTRSTVTPSLKELGWLGEAAGVEHRMGSLRSETAFVLLSILVTRANDARLLDCNEVAADYDKQIDDLFLSRGISPANLRHETLLSACDELNDIIFGMLGVYAHLNKELNGVRAALRELANTADGALSSAIANGLRAECQRRAGTARRRAEMQINDLRTDFVAKRKRGTHPKETIQTLKAWLHAHPTDPYPDEIEKQALMRTTGLTLRQLDNWFINARRRILQPMMERARHEAGLSVTTN